MYAGGPYHGLDLNIIGSKSQRKIWTIQDESNDGPSRLFR